MSKEQQIVPGISVTASGQATIDRYLNKVLFDLAINLEEPTNLPVDIEHVVAAIVLAGRQGQIDANRPITPDDKMLLTILTPHVKTIFARYGGKLDNDD